jgi:hypothetical protein
LCRKPALASPAPSRRVITSCSLRSGRGSTASSVCTDPKCYQAKLDAHIKQTIASKPKLVQISAGYGQPRDGDATVPRNKYVEIRQDKPQRKEERDLPEYKTCKYTAEAIVTEEGMKNLRDAAQVDAISASARKEFDEKQKAKKADKAAQKPPTNSQSKNRKQRPAA